MTSSLTSLPSSELKPEVKIAAARYSWKVRRALLERPKNFVTAEVVLENSSKVDGFASLQYMIQGRMVKAEVHRVPARRKVRVETRIEWGNVGETPPIQFSIAETWVGSTQPAVAVK